MSRIENKRIFILMSIPTFYVRILFACLFLLPAAVVAQKAPDLIPQNNTIEDTAKQTDLLDVSRDWLHIHLKPHKERPENKIYFTFLPLSNTPTGSGNALVTSTTANIYLGPKSTTFISSANFAPYLNFRGRFGLPVRSSIWTKNNTWNIQGDIRFLVYPQNTWGLGDTNSYKNRTLIDYRYIRFYQAALKRIRPHLFVGLGYDLDYRFNIVSDDTSINLKQFTGYAYGTSGHSVSSGVTLNVLYDTRNKDIYPFPGFYANIVYRLNPVFLGNTNYWSSLLIDVRKYIPLNPSKRSQQNTLAFWSYYWTALNNGTPYLDLPSTGWDEYNRSARGFDQNRYRGKSLFYFETEYRRDLRADGLFGFVVYSNVNTVSGTGTMFKTYHPGGGAGLRVKFSKASNTNFGMDYGMSKNYETVNFSFSEAF